MDIGRDRRGLSENRSSSLDHRRPLRPRGVSGWDLPFRQPALRQRGQHRGPRHCRSGRAGSGGHPLLRQTRARPRRPSRYPERSAVHRCWRALATAGEAPVRFARHRGDDRPQAQSRSGIRNTGVAGCFRGVDDCLGRTGTLAGSSADGVCGRHVARTSDAARHHPHGGTQHRVGRRRRTREGQGVCRNCPVRRPAAFIDGRAGDPVRSDRVGTAALLPESGFHRTSY